MHEKETKEKKKPDFNASRPMASSRGELNYDSGVTAEEARQLGLEKEYSGWDVYSNEAKKVDTELVNDWKDSLNSLLLFVSTFSSDATPILM